MSDNNRNTEQVHAFVDTNVFLHFNYQSINWSNILSSHNYKLWVTLTTMTELQSKSTLGGTIALRRRAKEVLKWLHSDDEKHSTASNSSTYSIHTAYPMQDRHSELPFSVADNMILASALDYQSLHDDISVVIVTMDGPLSILSKAHNLKAIKIPDEYRVDLSDDSKQEIQKLRDEIASLKNREPNLSLVFEDGSDTAYFKYYNAIQISEAEISNKLQEARNYYDEELSRLRLDNATVANPFGGDLIQKSLISLSRAEGIKSYKADIDSFLKEYEKTLKQFEKVENDRRRIIRIVFRVKNTGTSPATNIHGLFHVPNGVKPFKFDNKSLLPLRYPEFNHSMLHYISPQRISYLNNIDTQRYEPNTSGFSISKSNSFNYEWDMKRLQHGASEVLSKATLYIEDLSMTQFVIDYTIRADECRSSSTGVLHVNIDRVHRDYQLPMFANKESE